MTIDFTEGIQWYFVFLFSTTAHEAAHAWTAYKLGDDTAHRGGQVTLDPIPHIRREPVGMVAVPIISYLLGGWMIGWASAPYNVWWAIRHPRHAAAMSLAGPAANFAILLLAALFIHLGIAFQSFSAPDFINFSHLVDANSALGQLMASLLSIAFSLNLLLCTFNLLPLPPLDGSGILMFFVSEESAEKYMNFMQHPTLRFVGLLIAWQMFKFVYPPVHALAVHLLYPGIIYQ